MVQFVNYCMIQEFNCTKFSHQVLEV